MPPSQTGGKVKSRRLLTKLQSASCSAKAAPHRNFCVLSTIHASRVGYFARLAFLCLPARTREAMRSSLPPKLDICDDPRFQQREWRMQRLFWLLMYVVLLAVMLGAIGKGVLSDSHLGSLQGPLHFEYERFLRYRAAGEMRVTVSSPYDTTRISLDGDYFRQIGIQGVFPEPKNILMTEDATIMIFDSISAEPTMVTISVSPDRIGLQHGWIAVDGGTRYPFKQFVYP
jgi:hypothetical protein